MQFEEVPHLTLISIRMMSKIIYKAISQIKRGKKKKKTITARLLSVQVFRKTVTSVSSHNIKTTYRYESVPVRRKTNASLK